MRLNSRNIVPEITDYMYEAAIKLIIRFDTFERAESERNGISHKVYEDAPKPFIIGFVPGINEIKQMHQRLDVWRRL